MVSYEWKDGVLNEPAQHFSRSYQTRAVSSPYPSLPRLDQRAQPAVSRPPIRQLCQRYCVARQSVGGSISSARVKSALVSIIIA